MTTLYAVENISLDGEQVMGMSLADSPEEAIAIQQRKVDEEGISADLSNAEAHEATREETFFHVVLFGATVLDAEGNEIHDYEPDAA